MSKVLHVLAIALCGIGLILCIVSESTNYWYEREISSNQKAYTGLWKACAKSNSLTICNSITLNDNESRDKMKTTRAFTIMAIIAYGMAGLCLILAFMKKILVIFFIIAMALAAFLQMIGMAVFTDYAKDAVDLPGAKYGWSFALGWVGFAIAIIDCCLGVALKLFSSD